MQLTNIQYILYHSSFKKATIKSVIYYFPLIIIGYFCFLKLGKNMIKTAQN